MELSAEVREALNQKQPVVALESTIISHGMPWPQNYETALSVEDTVRKEGAIPATIAIIEGKIKVGLTKEDIQILGQADAVMKLSAADIPYALYKKAHGATTVSGTVHVAHQAGIPVFATGGIGGVHRDFGRLPDVSADLQSLSKYNVAVICSGIKSILDLPATMEYLESLGVPVAGFQSRELAAFYSRKSGIMLNMSFDSAAELAEYLNTKWNNGFEGGLLVSNPIPEEHAMDPESINRIIDQTLAEAKEKKISGKGITPFLLNRIKEQSQGESLTSNIALIHHNAKIAANIALELAR